MISNNLPQELQQAIAQLQYGQQPKELYEPISYLMQLGGKRLRPLLCLLAYKMWQPNYQSMMLPAIAVEVFHNFTLMHDDIMDDAPLRRGNPTVHEKWNTNIAILSGDVMLVKAYELLLNVPLQHLPEALRLFNKCATEVCEGQQLDMNFEKEAQITQAQYIEMIKLKTAVLLGFSLQLGALAAGTSVQNQEALREFGTLIGIGFQLKDDLLDVYGESAKFGKFVGGDIVANKKTFLLIEALQRATPQQKATLEHWIGLGDFDKAEKVKAVTSVFDEIGIKQLTENEIAHYFEKGMQSLAKVEVAEDLKADLKQFAQLLMERES